MEEGAGGVEERKRAGLVEGAVARVNEEQGGATVTKRRSRRRRGVIMGPLSI